MTWRERYRLASFRGFTFRVGVAGELVGRRHARHEYPLRDLPWMEDLGRRARAFRIDGWVVGEDFDRQRDALIAASEKTGPGEFVHPTRGRMLVTCEGLEVREDTREGGLARLSFVFIEAGQPDAPGSTVDAGGVLEDTNAALRLAAEQSFAPKINVFGMPNFVLDAIADAARELENFVSLLLLDGPANSVSRLLSSVSGLADRLIDVAADPFAITGEIGNLIREIPTAIRSRQTVIDVLRGFYSVENPAFNGLGLQQFAHENGAAIVDFAATIAIGEAVRLSASVDYESLDEALALRGALAEVIDGLELREGTADAEFHALEELRAALFGAVPPADQDLPHLAQYTPARTLPSLVIAYGLYGDRDRAGEIVARNRIRRPGFVPGGEPLEVLSG